MYSCIIYVHDHTTRYTAWVADLAAHDYLDFESSESFQLGGSNFLGTSGPKRLPCLGSHVDLPWLSCSGSKVALLMLEPPVFDLIASDLVDTTGIEGFCSELAAVDCLLIV